MAKKKREQDQPEKNHQAENIQNGNGAEKSGETKESGSGASGENIKADVEQLKEEVAQLKQDLEEKDDKYLRLLAEFDNYRRRSSRENLELRKTASEDILADLLPVLDDFDRALKVIDEKGKDDSVAEGVKLVHSKLIKTLKARGLAEMDTENAEFNPDYHEALTEVPALDKKMKGKIVDTIEKGYMLNDKIIRFAKVVVGK